MINKESIAAKVIESGGKLTVKSALNPILWLCAIVSIPSLVISSFLSKTPNWLVFLILSPVCAAIVGFLVLLIFDRDKLQSENYQLQKRSMELIQNKGEAVPQLIDPSKIELIENPDTKSNLEDPEQ